MALERIKNTKPQDPSVQIMRVFYCKNIAIAVIIQRKQTIIAMKLKTQKQKSC